MQEESKQAERGSSKLFALEAHDHEGLTKALGLARTDYQIKRWWKYGQPAIDLIRAELEVNTSQLGAAVTKLMQMNGRSLQVTAECFPYGIPVPEVFRLQVNIQKNL